MQNSQNSVWIINPHGVVVALPEKLAAERLSQGGYFKCDPEQVPLRKHYPLDGELTEDGERRRMHRVRREEEPLAPVEPIEEKTEASLKDMSWNELQRHARGRGINPIGMSREKLESLLGA